jgi:hypothetical protein
LLGATETQCCFVAGTLIHTDKGLVPIEHIKVGDMVLSKPENGEGGVAYKPVIDTFEFDDKEIWYVEFQNSLCYERERVWSGEIPYYVNSIVGTPNHLFRALGKLDASQGAFADDPKIDFYPNPYWSRLNELTIDTVVLLANGLLSCVTSVQPVSVMPEHDLGFIQGHSLYRWWDENCGSYIDLKSAPKLYNQKYNTFFNDEIRHSPNYPDKEWLFPTKKRKVYNFKLGDYHTYFVGEGGIWVHSNNNNEVNIKQTLNPRI